MSSIPTPSVTLPTVPTTTAAASASHSDSTTSTTPTTSASVPPTTTSSVPTTSATTQSSSSSSSSSSGSTSAPLSTTGTAASSTSSTSSTTAPSTSQSSSSSTSISYLLKTSDGQVFTQTSFVTASPPTQSTSNRSSNNSFFHNKGAVAGVFSVIGVAVIVLAFFLFTSYLRRRRAREFDREIDEAAAAAATARPPDFDDYDYNSATGGYGHYSETSHGTLSQAPLSHDQPRNPDGSYDTYSAVGVAGSGAAGVGARGRSLRNGGQQDPYGAFANPPEQYEMQETGRTLQHAIPRGGTDVPNYDILQAAGLSSSDPYAVTRGPSIRAGLTYGQSQSGASGLVRNQSQGTSALPTTLEGYPMPVPTPAPVYSGGQDTAYVPEKARYAQGSGASTMPPDLDEDAYDGYQEQPGTLDNPHSPGFSGDPAGDEQNTHAPYAQDHEEAARASFADDEDYGYTVGQRVLRVANE